MYSPRAILRRLVYATHHRLVSRRRPRRPAAPPRVSELFAALDPALPGLAGAVAEYRAGRSASAQALLAQHFRTRATPRFFIDGPEVAAAAERARRDFPDWAQGVAGLANEVAEGRLGVYADVVRFEPPGPWAQVKPGPGSDNLYPVRPHRFGFVYPLILATAYGEDHTGALEQLIGSWRGFAYSRRGAALAYSSPLVAAYRTLALSWALAMLSAKPVGLHITSLQILLADIRYIFSGLGQSFPNNHLLADGFITWYCGFLFPEFRESSAWRHQGEAVWLRELARQILPDGTSFEHSVHYHEMACEMASAYVLLKQRNGLAVDAQVLQRLERMLRFQMDLAGPEAVPIALGDTTEDPLFPLDATQGWGSAASAEIYRALFADHPGPPAEAPARQRAYWLLGGTLPATGAPGPPAPWASYQSGGYHVLGQGDGRSRVLFRTGPAPDQPVCPGHMHADLLTVFATVDGQSFVAEAGTYSYRTGTDPAWRAHFLGPAAHNGLVIPGADPIGPAEASFRGPRLEARIVTTALHRQDGLSWVAAVDEGDSAYRGHARGVVHVHGEYWLVYDRLPPDLPSSAYLHLQLGADSEARPGAAGEIRVALPTATASVLVVACTLGAADIACGRLQPPRGWVSPGYGRLLPAPSLAWPVGDGDPLAVTILAPAEDADPGLRVAAHRVGATTIAIEITRPGAWTDRLLLDERGAEAGGGGLHMAGRLVRVRASSAGQPVAFDCVGAERVRDDRFGLQLRAPGAVDLSLRREGARVVHAGEGAVLTWHR